MTNEEVKKIAEDHWSYVKSVIDAHDKAGRMNESERRMSEAAFKLCEFHYITAFVHGWKHGVEEEREAMSMERLEKRNEDVSSDYEPVDPLSYFRGS